MITRKKGETNKQWAARCEAYAKMVTENNRALRVQLVDNVTVNPRTNKTYQEEAATMYEAITLMEHFYRNGNADMAKMICESVVNNNLGYNEVDVVTDKLIAPGAYDGTYPKIKE